MISSSAKWACKCREMRDCADKSATGRQPRVTHPLNLGHTGDGRLVLLDNGILRDMRILNLLCSARSAEPVTTLLDRLTDDKLVEPRG
jgi:hypothetical protein